MSTIITGDDSSLIVELKKKVDNINQKFVINPDAIIKAVIINIDKSGLLTDVITIDKTMPGTDLNNSTIVIQFTEQQTGQITITGKAFLEIQVNDSGKLTWFVPITIGKGNIS